MGMNLVPNKGKKDFQRSWWTWRPLWEFAEGVMCDAFTIEEGNAGRYNDGFEIDGKKAEVLGGRISAMLKAGTAQRYVSDRDAVVKAFPLVECRICAGTGVRKDMKVPGGCNGCDGSGKHRRPEAHYTLTVEDVEGLAKFAAKSGGFKFY